MRKISEACIYIVIIVILVLVAIIVPLVVMYDYTPPPRYIFLGLNNTVKLPKDGQYKIIYETPSALRDYFDESLFLGMHEDYVLDYFPLHKYYSYLDEFVEKHRLQFSMNEIGNSRDGNPIKNIVLMKGKKPKPIVVIVSGIVANDWTSIMVTIHLMNRYLEDTRTQALLEKFNLHFLSLLNPDGYKFSMEAPPINRSWTKNGAGVNILHNFDERWVNFNETDSPAYGGERPFSEPESINFRDYILKFKTEIKAVFFLFSPPANSEEYNILTFPEIFLLRTRTTARFDYFKSLTEHFYNETTSHFKYKIFDSEQFNRIDNWVSLTSSNNVFVLNIQANYREDVTLNTRLRIKELGDDIHFMINTILNLTLLTNPDFLNM